jgi:hypothetical protein
MRKYIIIGVGVILLATVNFFFFVKQKLPTQGNDVSQAVTPADPGSLIQGDTTAVVTKNGIVTGTGLTKCYDNETEIECPKHGETFYGQDANYSINQPSYTKLSSDGNVLPDDAASWAMVRDDLTGLVWEMKDKSDGKKDYSNPHDSDNTYTWYDKESNFGTPGNGDDTAAFTNALNAARYGGYADWRLPTISELLNLLQLERRPHNDKTYFPHLWVGVDCTYWSSSICRTVYRRLSGQPFVKESRIWQCCFESFLIVNDYGANRSRAIAVRGRPVVQSHDFIDNTDGVITDNTTGLMWQKATAPGTYDWKQALAYCDNLTLAGYTDWRLPTAKELHSIVYYDKIRQCINTDYFPDTWMDKYLEYYWSSTTEAGSPPYAYGIEFRQGSIGKRPKSETYYVRAVRGGQLAGMLGDGLKVLGTSVQVKGQQKAQSSFSTVTVPHSENLSTSTVASSHIEVSKKKPHKLGIETRNGVTQCYENDIKIECPKGGKDFGICNGKIVALHDLTDNNNGTVTDNTTGLMWQKAAAPADYSWEQALAYCDNLTLAGYSDWRLPTSKELQSIACYGTKTHFRGSDYFPDTRMDGYWNGHWSSTLFPENPVCAYLVDFKEGKISFSEKSKIHPVRAVRGRQLKGLSERE